MAGVYVNDEGTWKLPKSIWVKSGTSTTGSTGWRVCRNVYIRYDGKWFEMMKTVDLTTSQQNFNLYEFVGSPTEPLSLIFNIDAPVTISSYDVLPGIAYNVYARFNIAPRTPAFTVGNFPAGSTVIINNNGYISGGGGFGGSGSNKISNGYNYPNAPAAKGGDGSYGITKGSTNSYDCTVVNTGTIAGGGGGGGGSGGAVISSGFVDQTRIGFWDGGDGAGITGYSRSIGQSIAPATNPDITYFNPATGAGRGGDCGQNGQIGWYLSNNKGGYSSGGFGGLGKFAINTDGIEIAVSGTILGGVG